MMEGQNPVYVISFGGLQKEAKKEEEEKMAEKRQIPRILIASPASGNGDYGRASFAAEKARHRLRFFQMWTRLY